MLKIALDAGHYIGTPGKRTPSGVREWTLNNRVLLGFKNEIEKYDGVSIVRTDDPSGKRKTSLTSRTNKAKNEKCDILISFHHNAYQSKWGNHGGTETWIYKGRKSENLANALQNSIVSTLKLRNRGVKVGNMHMNREVPFPSALIEIGFMDSKTDHDVIVNEANSTLVGKNMAIAVAKLYNLVLKPKQESNSLVGTKFTYKKGTVIYNNNPKPTPYPKQPTRNHEALIVQETGEWLKIRIAVLNPTDVWIYKKDMNGTVTKPPVTKKLDKGSKVLLLDSAKKYATGQNIPNSLKGKTYTVQQLRTNEALLKELYSWVNVKDVKVV